MKTPSLLVHLLLIPLVAIEPAAAAAEPVASAAVSPSALSLQPLVSWDFAVLVVAGPEGIVFRQRFEPGEPIFFLPADAEGRPLADGVYRWELRLVRELPAEVVAAAREAAADDPAAAAELERRLLPTLLRRSGKLTVAGGALQPPAASPPAAGATGAGGEAPAAPSGGDDTTISNADPRLTFEDTDETDFYLEANGDALTVADGADTDILTIRSGAVGLFTATPDPEVELHVLDPLPEIRLEDTAQQWDLRVSAGDFQIVDHTALFEPTILEIDGNGGAYELRLGSDNVIADATMTGSLTIEGDLAAGSSRTIKKNLVPAPTGELLATLRELPLFLWSYARGPDGVRHLGPMAEDFHAALGLGRDERHLSPADAAGLALAAVQALADRLEAKEREVAELRRRLAGLESRLAGGEEAPEETRPVLDEPAPTG